MVEKTGGILVKNILFTSFKSICIATFWVAQPPLYSGG